MRFSASIFAIVQAILIVTICLSAACAKSTMVATTNASPAFTAEPDILPLRTASPNKYCQVTNNVPSVSETGYLGIHPGFTQRHDLIDALGKPLKISDTVSPVGKMWIYEDASYSILLEADTVTLVTILYDSNDSNNLTLEQTLAKLGCPTYAEMIIDDAVGLTRLGLVFISYGVTYAYPNFPAILEDKAYAGAFFEAGSSDEFQRLFPNFSGDTLVELSEAIK